LSRKILPSLTVGKMAKKQKLQPVIEIPASLDPNKLVNTDTIACHFPLTNDYLRKLRSDRRGPRCYKLGKTVLYKPAEVADWLNTVIAIREPQVVI